MGMRIERMPLNDMCDLLHFYFEQDNLVDENIHEARFSMRREIYGRLYERSYSWNEPSKTKGSSGEFGTQEVGVDPLTGAPELESKPYVPPTPFDPTSSRPFGAVLDPPLE